MEAPWLTTRAAPAAGGRRAPARPARARSLLRAAEVDTRLLGMVVALVVIWVGSTSSPAASSYRPGTCGTCRSRPPRWRSWRRDGAHHRQPQHRPVGGLHPGRRRHGHGAAPGVDPARSRGASTMRWIWVVTVVAAWCSAGSSACSRASSWPTWRIPSFVVTLGGLLVWRGVAWCTRQRPDHLADGPDIPAARRRSQGLRRGHGELGRRRRRLRRDRHRASSPAGAGGGEFGFPLRPMWVDVALGAVGCVVVMGAVWVANSYSLAGAARRPSTPRSTASPGHRAGSSSRPGIAIPGAHRARCRAGHDHRRHPAPLRPIRVRDRRQPGGGRASRASTPGATIVKTFVIMGVLAAVAAAVASRLASSRR